MGVKAKHEASGLVVGDVVYCSSLTMKNQLLPGTFVSSTVRAKKGTVLVALLLGEEVFSGPSVDIVEVMRRMGWQMMEGRTPSPSEIAVIPEGA